ncbi:MAG: HIT family protein [Candidatus Thorarchaeota archaeon]
MIRKIDCIFCKIADGEIPSRIIFENELTMAFLDIFPISEGHTIIISKNHHSNLEDIPDFELIELYKVVKKLAYRIHKYLEIDGYNILQNNFSAAGQEINHFHVHIIPRKVGDKKLNVKVPKIQASENELEKIYNILRF